MRKAKGSILIVDDNEEILLGLRLLLEEHFEKVSTEKDPNLIPSLIREENRDVVILDMNFRAGINSGNEGLYWLKRIRGEDPGAVVIFITAYGDVGLAVEAIRQGAADFIQKPWNEEKLLATVHSALALRKSKLEIRSLRYKQQHLRENIEREFLMVQGGSRPMKKVMEVVEKVSGTEANVLITGENGTGKELIAREIHRRSPRKDEVFVSIDMNALSETLFESEMFGHVRGAFTDAREDKPGRFEIASGGSLFLDEIGNLPMHLQSKLLSVIQNREINRVGSARTIPVDVRLISATNRNLDRMVGEGNFRRDLLYRINTIHLEVPPLRERRSDIPVLANHFLEFYGKKYGKEDARFSRSLLERMKTYEWPGNIRQLQHAVEKAVILSEGNSINLADMYGSMSANVMRSNSLSLQHNEKYLIMKAIEMNRGNLAKSSRDLGISRKTLYNKIRRYEI